MLFKLLGSAKVLNVKVTSEELASVQVIANRGTDDSTNGSRWITVRGKAAGFIANQGDKLKGALVHVDATATTNISGDKFYENYGQTEFNVLAFPDNAKYVKTQPMILTGSGRVINIRKVSDKVAILQVISSIKTKSDQDITCTRWIKVLNETAKFWIENTESVLKSIVHFEANALTNNHNGNYRAEYLAKGNGVNIVSWNKTNTPASNEPMGYPEDWDRHEYVNPDEMDQAMAANQQY